MSEAVALAFPALSPETATRPPTRPKPSWALMGDIVSARGGVSEHLIEWCRASGENDPAPQF